MGMLTAVARAAAQRAVAGVRFRRKLAMMSRLSSVTLKVEEQCTRRLNLIVPSVAPEKVFGGISTALRLLHALGQEIGEQVHRRVLVLDDDAKSGDRGGLAGYERTPGDSPSQAERTLSSLGRNVSVRETDLFVATHWTTALIARGLLGQQARAFRCDTRPLFYLIQDFEPSFSPWSAEYLLAESTYSPEGGGVVGVFNTRLLYDYFVGQGYKVSKSYVFEPRMNPTLRALLAQENAGQRKRQILVYGRPSKPRNGFWLIIEALKVWSRRYAEASRWKVVSIGERHPTIELRKGLVLQSMGKLSLEQYAALLKESSVGVALMISPHPSYTPLEMTHFGVDTITNSFGGKDLSQAYCNIRSLSPCTPEAVACAIEAACERYSVGGDGGYRDVGGTSPFLRDEPEFPFIRQLADDVSGAWNRPGGG